MSQANIQAYLKEWDAALLQLFLELIEICDSFDQLGKLAKLGDLLYDPSEYQHPILFQALEKTALHLRAHRNIGLQEPGGANAH